MLKTYETPHVMAGLVPAMTESDIDKSSGGGGPEVAMGLR